MENATPTISRHQQFELWLKVYMPYLSHIWDFKKGVYSEDAFRNFLCIASSGEAHMARFAMGVWKWENTASFDIYQAVGTLDEKNIAIITNWLKHPFWP